MSIAPHCKLHCKVRNVHPHLLLANRVDVLETGPKGVGGDRLHRLGDGGGEQERLTRLLGGNVLEDLVDLRLEAHLQELVGLVEDEDLDGAEGLGDSGGVLEVVDEPSGSGHEQVDRLVGREFPLVSLDVGAADDADDVDGVELGELPGLVLDLGRELPGGGEDKREDVPTKLVREERCWLENREGI